MFEPQRYYNVEEVKDSQHHWTKRVLLASFPTRSMGPIVRAVLGKQMARGPKLSLQATVSSDGSVFAGLKHDEQVISYCHPIALTMKDGQWGTKQGVHILRDEFRRMADHCRLNDAERLELFGELRKWLGKDLRSDEDRAKV